MSFFHNVATLTFYCQTALGIMCAYAYSQYLVLCSTVAVCTVRW